MLRPQRKAVRMIMRMNMNLAGGGMGKGQSRAVPWEKARSRKRMGVMAPRLSLYLTSIQSGYY